MTVPHGKLVRDKIPFIIDRNGEVAHCRTLEPPELLHELRRKLVEEAQEAQAADSREALLTELADLSEVIEATLEAARFSRHQLRAEQDRRRTERGGFRERIYLISTSPKAAP